MRVEARTESLWHRLVWPILWRLLLAEGVLITLCVIGWGAIWIASMPPALVWQAHTWLVLALLSGTGTIVAIFFVMLRQRLRHWEAAIDTPCDRLEHLLREVQKDLPFWLKPQRLLPVKTEPQGPLSRFETLLDGLETLLDRLGKRPRLEQMLSAASQPAFIVRHDTLVETNTAFEQLVGRTRSDLRGIGPHYLLRHDERDEDANIVRIHDAQGQWHVFRLVTLKDGEDYQLGVLEDVQEIRQRISQLTLSRDHAREESRLKSNYLELLQRELNPLVVELNELFARLDMADENLLVRERLADIAVLVANLVDTPESQSPTVEPEPKPVEYRILVVDDGPVNTMLAHNVLESQGLTVDTADNGRIALEKARQMHYDLVFMDIFMPDPDGIETSRLWRAREATGEQTRRSVLVALTASATDEDRRRFADVGMDDCIAKPYRPSELVDMIQRWLPQALQARST
ncbi:response regulator [Aidingimonas lacisalsi]|uniref:response regulator n=1 Tax=Aidingimonas lacisalsi TaxID=2604086 RepID=UPI0013755882|nr:response regulator [Aidingimonas lacisalsi]